MGKLRYAAVTIAQSAIDLQKSEDIGDPGGERCSSVKQGVGDDRYATTEQRAFLRLMDSAGDLTPAGRLV
jgi:hypothetical protein